MAAMAELAICDLRPKLPKLANLNYPCCTTPKLTFNARGKRRRSAEGATAEAVGVRLTNQLVAAFTGARQGNSGNAHVVKESADIWCSMSCAQFDNSMNLF